MLFVALEMSTRYYLFGPASLSFVQMNSVQSPSRCGLVQSATLPGVVFELKPNLDTYFKLKVFRTNSRGLRDREHTLQKPPNSFRVAVVGSSYTLPAGVAIEDAFHSLLEERLTKQAPRRYEFINFAVARHSVSAELATLREKAGSEAV